MSITFTRANDASHLSELKGHLYCQYCGNSHDIVGDQLIKKIYVRIDPVIPCNNCELDIDVKPWLKPALLREIDENMSGKIDIERHIKLENLTTEQLTALLKRVSLEIEKREAISQLEKNS